MTHTAWFMVPMALLSFVRTEGTKSLHQPHCPSPTTPGAAVVSRRITCLITVVTGIWFTWGGIRDIRRLFRSFAGYKIDDTDNGTVEQHKPW